MSEFSNAINSATPTLVDFYATWCGPCKMMHPILAQLKKKVGDKAKILTIDVDRNQALAASYRIQSVPTVIVFKGGEVKYRGSGVHQADDLERILNGLYDPAPAK